MPGPTMARTRVALLAVGVTLVGGGLFGLAPGQATASSHREAPLISGQPQYDNTDVYAFVSPDRPDTTTLIANWIPFEDPSGGPTFSPGGAWSPTRARTATRTAPATRSRWPAASSTANPT